jgi:hypothetical protein
VDVVVVTPLDAQAGETISRMTKSVLADIRRS